MTHKSQWYLLFRTAVTGAVLVTLAVSAASAKTALSDQTLENAVKMKGAFNQETLKQASDGFEHSESNHHAELRERIDRNNQQIQEISLDGSEMSQYLTQKKRAGQNPSVPEAVKRLDMTHVVHHITDENITISYPDGLVVEMKPYK
jgi:TolA-binding protein